MFGNDDLFNDLPKVTSTKSKRPLPIDDDLFGDVTPPVKPVTKPGPSNNDDLFSDIISKPIAVSHDSDDLFNNEVPKPITNVTPLSIDLFTVKKEETAVTREEDLFTSLDTPTTKHTKPKPQHVGDDSIIPSTTTAAAIVSDNIDSIFTDVPDINNITSSSSSSKKDDLFGSSPPAMKPPETTVIHLATIHLHVATTIHLLLCTIQ